MFFKTTIIIFMLSASITFSQNDSGSVNTLRNKELKQIIFLFPSPNAADSAVSNEAAEIYSDYYHYVRSASPVLKELGITLKDTTSNLIKIKYDDDKIEPVEIKQGEVAYIFNDGKQKPKIVRHVMTNGEIVSTARIFFNIK